MTYMKFSSNCSRVHCKDGHFAIMTYMKFSSNCSRVHCKDGHFAIITTWCWFHGILNCVHRNYTTCANH